MTGPKDIAIGILVLALIAASITGVVLKAKLGTAKAKVETYEEREKNWREELSDCAVTAAKLQEAIDERNEAVEGRARFGVEARNAQRRADDAARRLVHAEDMLEEMLADQQAFDELVADVDTCEVYRLALMSIAGEVP